MVTNMNITYMFSDKDGDEKYHLYVQHHIAQYRCQQHVCKLIPQCLYNIWPFYLFLSFLPIVVLE